MEVEQRVQVEILNAPRPYSYAWFFNPLDGGKPLQIGDKVELPPNQVQQEGSSGVVSAVGTPYKGELKRVVRVIQRYEDDITASKAAGILSTWDGEDLWGGFGEGKYA